MKIKFYKFSQTKWYLQFEMFRSAGKYDPHIHYRLFRDIKIEIRSLENRFYETVDRYLNIEDLKLRYPNDKNKWLSISNRWFKYASECFSEQKCYKIISKMNEEYKTNFVFGDFSDESFIEVEEPEILLPKYGY